MKNVDYRLEDKQVIDYVRYCLSLPNGSSNAQGENTIIMLYTNQYGIMTPNRVFELIAKGSIVVTYNDNKKAA